MTPEEKPQLLTQPELEHINDLLEQSPDTHGPVLGDPATESDLLEQRITQIDTLLDRFVRLLEIFEKLTQKIHVAFMESRIWEQLEEYRQNAGKKKRKSGGRNPSGFDVQRKPRKPEE